MGRNARHPRMDRLDIAPWPDLRYCISAIGKAPPSPKIRQIILSMKDSVGGATTVPKYD